MRTAHRDGHHVGLLFSKVSITAANETTQENASRLAIDEINAEGGIRGVPLVPVAPEVGVSPEAFRIAAEWLCDVQKVPVIFGTHMSSTRKAVLPVVESRRTPLFYATLYEGFEYSPYCFYTGSVPNQNSVLLASHVIRHYGNRVMFIGHQYVYPRESNRIMRELYEHAGGTVVAETYLPLDAPEEDFERVLAHARDLRPDAIYSTVVGHDIVKLYRAYRRLGYDPATMPIASLATIETDLAAMPSEASEGHVTAAPWFDTLDTERSRGFVARYRARFGADAPITACAEAAYFQVHLVADAARRAGTLDAAELVPALDGAHYDAPQGRVTMDGDTHHTWLWPRIARVNSRRRFDILYSSPTAVRPVPYLVDHALNFDAHSLR
ncbi:transporter substrate-binding domain-containing protein [Caballeronia sp. LZ035]|uniref:transporter substrate-binding domain-containing protein n=1 Tax=Caballeronia sp. LZ035 TaxID=3038568 RepID=UPI00286164FB|nr:transporter substrate-binding domain-containing protein [Caballeronia sp. LZ035]MDR5761430.1 transporter substrate-binding domain-containing protein [Caballeronia sp. LZ035]